MNGVCCSSSHLKEDIAAELEDLRSADKGPITWNKYQTKEEVKTTGLFTYHGMEISKLSHKTECTHIV